MCPALSSSYSIGHASYVANHRRQGEMSNSHGVFARSASRRLVVGFRGSDAVPGCNRNDGIFVSIVLCSLLAFFPTGVDDRLKADWPYGILRRSVKKD